jgi:hypothetical protein
MKIFRYHYFSFSVFSYCYCGLYQLIFSHIQSHGVLSTCIYYIYLLYLQLWVELG